MQDSLAEAGLYTKRLHATGLQTLLKLVENQLNNLPLGYTYGRDQDNSPLLRMISPNMCRVGRNNERALDGPMRLPRGGGELLKEVQKLYNAWFRIWNASYVPKLLYQPKWWKQESHLKEGDIVMFQKRESELDESWSLGTVDQLVQSRDGLARRAILRYQNPQENFHRVSDRHIRSVVKIWSVDDQNVDEDLAALQRRLRLTVRGAELVDQLLVHGDQGPAVPATDLLHLDQVLAAASWACMSCCCQSHCQIGHTTDEKPATTLMRSLLSHRAVVHCWTSAMFFTPKLM